MSKFHKRAKKILKSLAEEYDQKKLEHDAEKRKGISSASLLRKKLSEHEKKTDESQQSEDD